MSLHTHADAGSGRASALALPAHSFETAARDILSGSSTLSCSVGIMAYNEEANIGAAVDSVLGQVLCTGEITGFA